MLTPFVSIWASRNAVRFHFFTRLPVATLRQHSWEKKSVWEAWKAYPEATEAFRFVDDSPFLPLEISTPIFNVLQRFVVILFDRTSLATDMNTARQELFTKKNRALENIPPTEVRTYHTQIFSCFCLIGYICDR